MISLHTLFEALTQDDDFHYNVDAWNNNQVKILFILGLSGSGKTTLGKEIAKKNRCEYFEIDTLWTKRSRIWKKETGKKMHEMSEKTFDTIYAEVKKELIHMVKVNRKKIVFEGIHVLQLSKETLKKNAVIIKDPSYWRLAIRKVKRDAHIIKKGPNIFIKHWIHYFGLNYKLYGRINKLKQQLSR